MRLAEFFRAIEPMLAERASAADTARTLYGAEPGEAGQRLAVYERMCRWRRAETMAGVYPRVRRAFAAFGDERAWSALCTAYYAEAPWTAVKPLPNAAGFPDFLSRESAGRGLPAWLAELADFEWWVVATRIARDPEDDPAAGPLRLAHTVELRPYGFDLVGWVDDVEAARPEPPAPGRFAVLFWRDRDGVACVRSVSGGEIRLLGLVRGGAAVEPAAEDLAALQRLHRIGVLVGEAGPWR